MDPVSPLRRIYQLVVQEESQRLASREYLKAGDRIVLAAKVMPEQRIVAARSGHGSFTRSGMALGFPSEEEDVSSFRMDGQDLISAARSDGPGHAKSLIQMSGRDSITGLDGSYATTVHPSS